MFSFQEQKDNEEISITESHDIYRVRIVCVSRIDGHAVLKIFFINCSIFQTKKKKAQKVNINICEQPYEEIYDALQVQKIFINNTLIIV